MTRWRGDLDTPWKWRCHYGRARKQMSWHCWRMMVTKWRVDGDKMRTTQEEMATNSSDFSSLPLVYMLFWVRNNVCSFFSHIRCTEPKIFIQRFSYLLLPQPKMLGLSLYFFFCCHEQTWLDFLFFPFFAVMSNKVNIFFLFFLPPWAKMLGLSLFYFFWLLSWAKILGLSSFFL